MNKKCFFVNFFLALKLWELSRCKTNVEFFENSKPKTGVHGIGLGIGLGLGLGGARTLVQVRYYSPSKKYPSTLSI